MTTSCKFWDVLAPYHSALENHYLDLKSIRTVADAIQEPVLVVGAGQGLIVDELRKRGLRCDGIDFSSEMARMAKLRRGLTLIEADARALPCEKETYATIIYATGVIDFIGDEEEIRVILNEGRRAVKSSGKIFVAFYRVSRALEDFMAKVGLLENCIVSHRHSLEMYLLNPFQMVTWIANQAGISNFRAAMLLFGLSMRTTIHEKAITFRMQRIFRDPEVAKAFIDAAPEEQPYRNEVEIKNLFKRLKLPIREIKALHSCWIVQIDILKELA